MKLITLSLAISTTCISMVIAILGACNLAQDDAHRIVIAAISCVAAIAVHVLPAISKSTPKPLTWSIWTLCFFFVVHNHSANFVAMTEQSSEARYSMGRTSRSIEERKDAIKKELSEMQVRPVATLARLIPKARSEEQLTALRLEMSEAQRAVELRNQLNALIATAGDEVTTDPFSARLAGITGWSRDLVTTVASILAAIVLELLGAIFWIEVRGARNLEFAATGHGRVMETSNDYSPRLTPHETTDLALLKEAVTGGSCTTRVADIRAFFRCSQKKAMLLHRELIQTKIAPVPVTPRRRNQNP